MPADLVAVEGTPARLPFDHFTRSACCLAQFVWYHCQDTIRRALGNTIQRLVNGRIALDANNDTLKEHYSDSEKQWDLIMA